MRDPAVLDAGIRAYLEAENAYTEAAMAPTEGLRKQLFAEMKARIKEDDSSVPSLDGPFAYYQRSEEHTSELQSLMRISYAVFCLKKKNNKNTDNTTKYINEITA